MNKKTKCFSKGKPCLSQEICINNIGSFECCVTGYERNLTNSSGKKKKNEKDKKN